MIRMIRSGASLFRARVRHSNGGGWTPLTRTSTPEFPAWSTSMRILPFSWSTIFVAASVASVFESAYFWVRTMKWSGMLLRGWTTYANTQRLRSIISELRRIEHVKIIRIGSKLPVFNPHRILDDPGLLEMISEFSTPKRKIYIMVHFNHPREITQQATEGVNLLLGAGAVLCNQTPLLRGVNDNADVLTELFNNLSYIGVAPYYVFICRPTMGNATFAVSVEDAIDMFENVRMVLSGLAGRDRLAMSHASGKIEVLGKDEERVYFRYHRAADEADRGRFLAFEHNPEAYWFDDYSEPVQDYSPQTSFSGARPGT